MMRMRTPGANPPLSNRKGMLRLPSGLRGRLLLPSSRFSRLALAVACVLLGFLILLATGAGRQANGQLLSDLAQCALAAWSAICALRVARRSTGYLRRLWLLLTVSVLLVSAAQILKTYYKHIAQLPFATPWPSDILFILWVIPTLAILLPRSDDESGGIDWPTILDFAQVGIVALTAYLYFFYLTSRWQAEPSQMVENVFRVQMYRDLAIAAVFLIAARASESGPAKTLFNGVTLFFLLETVWAFLLLMSRPMAPGKTNWSNVVWCAPYFFLTVFATRWKTEEAAATPPETLRTGKSGILSRVLP